VAPGAVAWVALAAAWGQLIPGDGRPRRVDLKKGGTGGSYCSNLWGQISAAERKIGNASTAHRWVDLRFPPI
jgi:hypothetical protein